MPKKPIVLTIMDGFGLSDEVNGNAVRAARTPRLDKLFAEMPFTQLGASGMDVGLPDGQMGNSEVGHTNMGAGRIVYQELTRITKAIQDGDFFDNKALARVMTCETVHLMGLVSDGGVHSHNTHLYALLEMAKRAGVQNVFVHCFLDGRDVPPASGKGFIEELQQKMKEIGVGRIATVMGRYYAMDRDNRWDRVNKAYVALVYGEGVEGTDAAGAVQQSYDTGVTDEFVVPVVCDKAGVIKPGDGVIFFNFRPDRARELTRALADDGFTGFERRNGRFPLTFVCMTQYDAAMPNVLMAFAPQGLTHTLGEVLGQAGRTQLRIAETEKYAHVTFFFNGGVETPYPGEDRVLIPSPKVATYDLKPSMSAAEVADAVVERILSGNYDVVVLNFANCDMVGHTGVFAAAVEAVETVDTCVGRVADAVAAMDGVLLVTADHGNADKMIDADGEPFTAHTTNPVPFCVVGHPCTLRGGVLADIAPTLLQLLNMPQPEEMTGKSLIVLN